MQSLTTHWQLADDLCALSFPWVFHTLHCACLAWPTRIRFATKFFVPLAPCAICHSPIANCQLPIETETVNMAASACRSISQVTVDAKIDAKSMPDFDATLVVKAHRSQPSHWAVTYGTAKVPQGAKPVNSWSGQASPETPSWLGLGFGLCLSTSNGTVCNWSDFCRLLKSILAKKTQRNKVSHLAIYVINMIFKMYVLFKTYVYL